MIVQNQPFRDLELSCVTLKIEESQFLPVITRNNGSQLLVSFNGIQPFGKITEDLLRETRAICKN
jgi:hypothetical protein